METEIKKKKWYKNKYFLFLILPMFICGVIATTYLVHNINLTVDVKEPFVVQYAILGDASNYNGEPCPEGEEGWLTLENGATFDKDGFYPMESRYVCIRIQNLGQATIPYVITSTTTGTDNLVCQYAFPNMQKTGNAVSGYNLDGALVTIPADAQVINDCNVNIKVERGTLPKVD